MAAPEGPLRHERSASNCSIAVVICTRDRLTSLLETLDSIWSQSRRPDELIVIDDGGLPARVLDHISKKCHANSIKWRYQRTESPGLTRARNRGAAIAESDILQYLDDDVTCGQGFLDEIQRIMRDPCVAGATAVVLEPALGSWQSKLWLLGYRLAGWWWVTPRRRPKGARPAVLSQPGAASITRRLCGAAMALRRDVVRAHPFDENLSEYGLGEDREMAYRLAGDQWLVVAERARVVHRRVKSGRADPFRLGFMTAYNYLYILSKTCRPGVLDWALIVWSLTVLAAMHAAAMLFGNRKAHFAELGGIIKGIAAWLWAPGNARTSPGPMNRQPPARTAPIIDQANPLRIRPSSRGPQRVLFVTNRLAPGGAESMLISLVGRLPQHGVSPTILCLQDAGPLAGRCRDLGIEVYENLLAFKTDAAVLLRMKQLVEHLQGDVLVAAHSGGDRMFWTTIAGQVTQRPVVVWSHWFPQPGREHFERPNRTLYRWVDAFVALGCRHRQALIEYEHVPAGRIHVIRNGVDFDRFAGGSTRSRARRRLGLADHHIAVGLVANLRREKRHDVFIRSAKRLATGDQRFRFLMIGDGPDRAGVQAAVDAAGLGREVLRLVGGRDDIAEVLPGLDMTCLCSEIECFSMVMLEAAAAGCAFIGPDIGGLTEFMQDRRNGLVIRPTDVVSLVDAIANLASAPELRRRLGEQARRDVVAGFGIERTVEGFAALFDALGSRTSTGRGRDPYGPRFCRGSAASAELAGRRSALAEASVCS